MYSSHACNCCAAVVTVTITTRNEWRGAAKGWNASSRPGLRCQVKEGKWAVEFERVAVSGDMANAWRYEAVLPIIAGNLVPVVLRHPSSLSVKLKTGFCFPGGVKLRPVVAYLGSVVLFCLRGGLQESRDSVKLHIFETALVVLLS